jgi:hypothetical protein
MEFRLCINIIHCEKLQLHIFEIFEDIFDIFQFFWNSFLDDSKLE